MTKEEIQSIFGSKIVSFHAVFAKAIGNVPAAIMLSQAFFWQEKAKHKDGVKIDGEAFFSKTADEWYEETGLTEDQQLTARKRLLECGFWFEHRAGLPAKMCYRIDIDILVAVISGYLKTGISVTVDNRKKKREITRTSSGKFRQLEAVENGDNNMIETKGDKRRQIGESIAAEPLSPPFTKTDLVIEIHDKETHGAVIVDFLPLEENKKKKKPSPGGGPNGDGWTKRVASIFDAVASENCLEAFKWQINSGRDFKALKEIRAAMVADIQRKKNHEPTEPEIESGFEYVFRYGFKYLSDVAAGRGGIVQFSPTTIKNCYNQIVLYAKQSVNGTLKNGTQQPNGLNKATAQHLDIAAYIVTRRQAAMERAMQNGTMAGTPTDWEV